jgi:hyperosmotically inducible periplasmic protein
MKRNSGMNKMILSAAVLGLAMAVPAFAQDNPGSASAGQSIHQAGQSMHQAGEAAEQAGSDTLNAAKHLGKGTATAMRDTKITAKVKVALHEDKATEDSDIHVDTVAGVVTLSGHVPSPDAAVRAEQLARQTEGVREVNNKLRVS